MSSLSPLGTRQYQNTALAGASQQPARGNADVQKTAATQASSNVALSSGAVGLQQRLDTLGNDTIDYAQSFLGSFARHLLGDNAKGATIAFDSVSLDASSSMAAGSLRSEGTGGVGKASAFSLSESSHFLGKGTITLADGTKYDFEVEVQYEASMSAGFASQEDAGGQDAAASLPAFDFPDIDWPGSLGDLFKLMDKQISGDVKGGEHGDVLGNLSVRLMKLVNSAQSLDTYAPLSPVKAYVNEATAAGANVKDTVPDRETGRTPAPIKVPADVPATGSASGIPPTISTAPPAEQTG
jgi:hypothetical protein